MATLVSFHAHPDDESIACGGVLRKAYEEGHRVVLVVACDGAIWEPNARLDEFRETKHVHWDFEGNVKPWWYPYGKKK